VAGGILVAAAVAGFFIVPLFPKPKKEKTSEPPAVLKIPPPPTLPKAEPPAPAKVEPPGPKSPPVKIADFNTDSRTNLRKGRFGAWNSSKPDPQGRASEVVQRIGGPDGSGCWQIDFDISNPGSYAGSWMELGNLDVTNYDTLQFKVRSSDPAGTNFIVEVKMLQGTTEVVRRSILHGIGTQWQTVEISLKKLNLPRGVPLTGLNFVFDQPVSGAKKSAIFIDDVEFVKKD
jgi:hypothetical protein